MLHTYQVTRRTAKGHQLTVLVASREDAVRRFLEGQRDPVGFFQIHEWTPEGEKTETYRADQHPMMAQREEDS